MSSDRTEMSSRAYVLIRRVETVSSGIRVEKIVLIVKYDDFAAVTMKSTIFRDVTQSSLVDIY
jgi:hypothetical protein